MACLRLTASSIGKTKRMNRLFPSQKGIIVPLDDNLISGTENGLCNIESKVRQIVSSEPNAILTYPGTLSLISKINDSIPTILNLTASTIRSQHTNKIQLFDVEQAIAFGVEAVAVHINISSKYENEMLKNLAPVKKSCDQFGIPLMLLIYPRREVFSKGLWQDDNYSLLKIDDSIEYTKLVAHCVRIAYEIGADIIKTPYTGSVESFSDVVQAAAGTTLLIAGGEMKSDIDFLKMIKGAIDAGASGVCIGRNVFNRPNTNNIINAVQKIIFNNFSVEKAIGIL